MKIFSAATILLFLTSLSAHAEPEISDVTVEKAAQLLAKESEQLLVLDIRTAQEFEQGHIASATNLDFYGAGFGDELAKLDKSKPYLVHCRSGGRSAKALVKMRELGFQKVLHLNAGFNGWLAAGKPVKK